MIGRSRSLGTILATRIILFAALAMGSQLLIVFADYYWDDAELSRLLVERETGKLAAGVSYSAGRLDFSLPADMTLRYGPPVSGYYARIRSARGQVLYSACSEECTEHFLPLDLKLPSFWLRTIRPGKPLALAGGRTFVVGDENVLVEIATIGDPQEAVWGVLGHEVMDHMVVPMGIILVFVLGATLVSVRTALRPVRAAAIAAEALDPMDAASHLETAGMPREIAGLADAVNRAFTRVGELMNAQKLLTSAIAHEVRTPLAVVKLELERIDHPRARKAEADLDELVRFVAQLTALARLEAVDHAAFRSLSVRELLETLLEGLAPWVYDQHHSITLEAEADLNVNAVESLLRDAVRNLIENAVKHTPPGTAITVSLRDRAIRIADDGGGYAASFGGDLPDSIRKSGGLGIGLEIVRRIARLHNADFRIVRELDQTVAKLTFS